MNARDALPIPLAPEEENVCSSEIRRAKDSRPSVFATRVLEVALVERSAHLTTRVSVVVRVTVSQLQEAQ